MGRAWARSIAARPAALALDSSLFFCQAASVDCRAPLTRPLNSPAPQVSSPWPCWSPSLPTLGPQSALSEVRERRRVRPRLAPRKSRTWCCGVWWRGLGSVDVTGSESVYVRSAPQQNRIRRSRGQYSLTWRVGCDMRHEVEISMEEWGSSIYSLG